MPQYIDKAVIKAEIEGIEHETNYEPFTDEVLGKRFVCRSLLSSLDTLETKEVDLEKEVNNWRHNHFHGKRDKDASGEYLERVSQLDLAKHFFELGLKAKDI